MRRMKLACSFCGRDETAVSKLVAGPRVHICDSCVGLAQRIIDEHHGGQPPAMQPPRGLLRRLLDAIGRPRARTEYHWATR
jgi:ATP-dependent protease Clp ATPase subunit